MVEHSAVNRGVVGSSPTRGVSGICPQDAGVAELADARDLKSLEGNFVPVRVLLGELLRRQIRKNRLTEAKV